MLCTQVIVTSDTVLSVRATVLLGQVLHLATLLLPHEISAVSQCLPELAGHIATHTVVSYFLLYFYFFAPSLSGENTKHDHATAK